MKNDILFSLKDNLIKLATQFTKSKIFKIGTRFAENRDQYENIMKVNALSYTAILIFFMAFLRGLFLLHLDCLLFLLMIVKIILVLRSKFRFNKLVILWIYMEICMIIFYYSSFGGITVLATIYYIPLLISLIFLYNFRTDLKYILAAFLFIIAQILILNITGYSLFLYPFLNDEYPIILSLIISFSIILITIIFTIFILRKQSKLLNLSNVNANQDYIINDLKIKVNESFTELNELAMKNSPSFAVRFNEVYPFFFHKLKEIQPDLTSHDLYFCAYLKLNYSSKEIANYTHVTLQAVQKKKNRLRKSLRISSDEDIYQWISNI